jgi:hypothetical protein
MYVASAAKRNRVIRNGKRLRNTSQSKGNRLWGLCDHGGVLYKFKQVRKR